MAETQRSAPAATSSAPPPTSGAVPKVVADNATVPKVITEHTPVSVSELQARPATLGLISLLGVGLLSALGFLFNRIDAVAKDLKDFQLAETATTTKLSQVVELLQRGQPEQQAMVAAPLAARATPLDGSRTLRLPSTPEAPHASTA